MRDNYKDPLSLIVFSLALFILLLIICLIQIGRLFLLPKQTNRRGRVVVNVCEIIASCCMYKFITHIIFLHFFFF